MNLLSIVENKPEKHFAPRVKKDQMDSKGFDVDLPSCYTDQRIQYSLWLGI